MRWQSAAATPLSSTGRASGCPHHLVPSESDVALRFQPQSMTLPRGRCPHRFPGTIHACPRAVDPESRTRQGLFLLSRFNPAQCPATYGQRLGASLSDPAPPDRRLLPRDRVAVSAGGRRFHPRPIFFSRGTFAGIWHGLRSGDMATDPSRTDQGAGGTAPSRAVLRLCRPSGTGAMACLRTQR